MLNSSGMLLGLNSFKTIVAQGSFPPKITHRQTEGNVPLLLLKLRGLLRIFQKSALHNAQRENILLLCSRMHVLHALN